MFVYIVGLTLLEYSFSIKGLPSYLCTSLYPCFCVYLSIYLSISVSISISKHTRGVYLIPFLDLVPRHRATYQNPARMGDCGVVCGGIWVYPPPLTCALFIPCRATYTNRTPVQPRPMRVPRTLPPPLSLYVYIYVYIYTYIYIYVCVCVCIHVCRCDGCGVVCWSSALRSKRQDGYTRPL